MARIAADPASNVWPDGPTDVEELHRVLTIVDLDSTGEVAVILAALDLLDGKPSELEAAEAAGAVVIERGTVRSSAAILARSNGATIRTTPGQRRATHRALAEALMEPRHRTRRAEHLAAAAIGHDAAAAAALAELGEESSREGGTTQSADYFNRAALLEPVAEEAAWYRFRSADSWWNAGAYAEARIAFVAAHEQTSQPVLRADIMLQLGQLDMYERGPRHARDLFVNAARAVAPHDIDRASNLLVHAASTAMLTADVVGALTLAREADDLAQRGNGVSALASSLMVAFLSLHHGDTAEFLERFPALRDVADVLLDADDPYADLFLQLVGMTQVYTEQWDSGRTYLTAVVHRVSRRDRSTTAALASATLAELCWRSGRWDEAWSLATSDLVCDVTLTGARLWLLAFTAHVDAGFGRAEDCRERAGRAIAEATPFGFDTAVLWARHALGLLELGLGSPADAVAHLEPLAAYAAAHEVIEPGIIWWQGDFVEALIRAGRHREAARALDRFEAGAALSTHSWAAAATARCRGLAASSIEIAECAFEEALAHHQRLTAPFELARTLLCRAQRRAASPTGPDPASDLAESKAIFDALGAAPWSAQVDQLVEQIGRRSDADWATLLSPAQQRVAAAVAEGLANREIATALFVSEKTVEFHLHNIFTRLGITSRTQLMRRMTKQP